MDNHLHMKLGSKSLYLKTNIPILYMIQNIVKLELFTYSS